MSHTDGFASMVELLDIRAVYVAANNVEIAFLEKRYDSVRSGIQRRPRLELECEPVMMSPAQSIKVFSAQPGKLRLEVNYTNHANAVVNITYSGAYAIHWSILPALPPDPQLMLQRDDGFKLTILEVIDLRERVAALCHVQWSNWTKHLLGAGTERANGSVTLPMPHVNLWRNLVATSFTDLNEAEQVPARQRAASLLKLISQSMDDD